MQRKTRIELAVPWSEARAHLPRALYVRLESFLVDRELSSFLIASFVFDADSELLHELLTRVEGKMIVAPGSHGQFRLFGRGGRQVPLLRLVRRWTLYDYVDLVDEPVVQLLFDRRVQLVPPLSQYYQAEIRPDGECSACGCVNLRQRAPLKVRYSQGEGSADEWRAGDVLAATSNHEVLISDWLKQLWSPLPSAGAAEFWPVDSSAGTAIWQVGSQGSAHLCIPPTVQQVRASCPACGRPVIVAYGTATGVLDGAAAETVYEDEAPLFVQRDSVARGDFWETDAQEGRVRFERDLLERFATDPEPFYVRTAAPFWLISNRLLRLVNENLPESVPRASIGWRCRPIQLT